jgi:heme a synthase
MVEAANSPVAALWIRRWLIALGVMVYAMILIGGMTRLTDSGLSITEWAPLKGALPPLSDAAWASEFAKYQQTAEYRLQNAGMSLEEFRFIYAWEWGHRFFGRLIGLVAIGGLLVFASRRWLGRALGLRLLGLVALGGLQGAIGWWMVSSGIGETNRVDVAPYRLMTHFTLALGIIAATFWLWLDLGGGQRKVVSRIARIVIVGLFGLIFVQMAVGALVAGLDAGRTYNDWPLMAGELVPSAYLQADLGIRSLFEGRAATQFNHRFLAYFIWGASLAAAWFWRRSPVGKPLQVVAGLVTLQALWGILTLLNAAPMALALVHQGLGVALSLAAVWLVWLTAPAGGR